MSNDKTKRHWAQVLAEMPDAKKVEDRQRLTNELLGSIGALEQETRHLRETRIAEIVEALPATDARQRFLALGQALAELIDYGPGEIRQELAAEIESTLDQLAGISGRAQSGVAAELSIAATSFGERAQLATNGQRLAQSFIPNDGEHGEPGK